MRRKKTVRQGSVQSISQVLPQVEKELEFDRRAKEWSLFSLWQTVIDKPFQGRSQAIRVNYEKRKTVLVISTPESLLATELQFRVEEYRHRLNVFKKETGIELDAIEVLVGKKP